MTPERSDRPRDRPPSRDRLQPVPPSIRSHLLPWASSGALADTTRPRSPNPAASCRAIDLSMVRHRPDGVEPRRDSAILQTAADPARPRETTGPGRGAPPPAAVQSVVPAARPPPASPAPTASALGTTLASREKAPPRSGDRPDPREPPLGTASLTTPSATRVRFARSARQTLPAKVSLCEGYRTATERAAPESDQAPAL